MYSNKKRMVYFKKEKVTVSLLTTLGAETFANFVNFAQIR